MKEFIKAKFFAQLLEKKIRGRQIYVLEMSAGDHQRKAATHWRICEALINRKLIIKFDTRNKLHQPTSIYQKTRIRTQHNTTLSFPNWNFF